MTPLIPPHDPNEGPEHPPHVYAAEVEVESSAGHEPIEAFCRTCGARIVWGLTIKGRRAPFDLPKTPDGYVNHWVTCKRPPARPTR